jgi:hypothetical protein
MEACVQRHDGPRGIALNHEFHRALSSRCGNKRLCDLLDELRSQVLGWSTGRRSTTPRRRKQSGSTTRSSTRWSGPSSTRRSGLLRQNRLQTYFAFVSEWERRCNGVKA